MLCKEEGIPFKKHTNIYILVSNLEYRLGAGALDLAEIANGGIDLEPMVRKGSTITLYMQTLTKILTL